MSVVQGPVLALSFLTPSPITEAQLQPVTDTSGILSDLPSTFFDYTSIAELTEQLKDSRTTEG